MTWIFRIPNPDNRGDYDLLRDEIIFPIELLTKEDGGPGRPCGGKHAFNNMKPDRDIMVRVCPRRLGRFVVAMVGLGQRRQNHTHPRGAREGGGTIPHLQPPGLRTEEPTHRFPSPFSTL